MFPVLKRIKLNMVVKIGISLKLLLLLRSSVSDGRPYSDCTVSSSSYFFPHFLSGRFLRDDLMDLLEIFRVDVKVIEVDHFYFRQKIHFRSVIMAVFRFFKRDLVRECSRKRL